MANRLTDLDVQFVSLVDRAAVRDPKNPEKPQRFLLLKNDREGEAEMPAGTAEERLTDALTNLQKADPGPDPASRQAHAEVMRKTQLEYLYAVSPAGAAAWERANDPDGVVPVAKADDELVRKAQERREIDPGLSKFEAMQEAMRADPDAASRYLESVR